VDHAAFRNRLLHGTAAGLACGALAMLCITYTRSTAGVAALWLSNALLVGWILRAPREMTAPIALAGFASMVLANMLTGTSSAVALGFSALNQIEITAAVALLRRSGIDPRQPLNERAFALGTVLAVLGAPALAAVVAATLIARLEGVRWVGAFVHWWVSDAFGMLTVLPIAFSAHRAAVRRLLAPRALAEFAAWIALTLLVVAASFSLFSRVFVVVALPLLVIAFRFGQFPATIANLVGAMAMVAAGSLARSGVIPGGYGQMLSQLEWGLYSAAMVIGPLMVAVTVDGMRRHAHALAQHLEHQRVTLNSIGDAMVACDRDLCITEFNPMAERMTGVPREKAIGRPVDDVVRFANATTGRRVVSPLRMVIASSQAASLDADTALEREGASPLPVEDLASPIRGAGGRITGAIMVFRDVTEQRALARQIAHQAQHDALTDLPNRTLLRDRLEQELRGIARGHAGCVMFLDLDRFKHINDTLGHAAGDEVLRGVAARLQAAMRDTDTVSREGGDEFVLLCPGLVADTEISDFATRLAAAVEQPHEVQGRTLSVRTSIGVARYPRDGTGTDELLRRADVALYHAKQDARGRPSLYAVELDRLMAQSAELERELRRALPANELFVEYQPQHDMASGAVVGMEALVRWRRDGRVVPPSDFLALAEETDLVVAIDRWVLREACAACSRWVADGLPVTRMSVNVSLAHFDASQLVADVRDALARSELPPECLEIEFTETQLLRAVEESTTAIARLRDLGVAVAIDDFGTGYSNFSQLSTHDFDVLKIDRSLVSRLPDDRRNVAVVRAMIAMANALDCRLVAEGVETPAQADWLRRHGCAVAQGFLYDRPLDAAHMRARLAAAVVAPAA